MLLSSVHVKCLKQILKPCPSLNIYVAHMFYDSLKVDKVLQGVDYLKQILYERNLFHVVTLRD